MKRLVNIIDAVNLLGYFLQKVVNNMKNISQAFLEPEC